MFQRGFIFRKSRFFATHRKHIQTVFGRGNDGLCCASIAKSNSGLKRTLCVNITYRCYLIISYASRQTDEIFLA